MTPFGARIRCLREIKGIALKTMAADLHVSSAYLSALEHGHRGRPAPGLVMQIAGYFGLIWDEAEDLKRLAELSHPRVTIDSAGLSPDRTELANRLAESIRTLSDQTVIEVLARLRDDQNH
ncbi:helix-turn-helix domain-containing protein [Magnetospirillum sulfuroxidans]|uniref:Helix-turn-helix domain-containing protein n=1 Tax=Magnetospirillum sulfuroxidans TaxID=611300 RepID=A0ABS5IEG8_9PROT|nr:helix-turn-helix domain-containing protein [Magnetospirillum sulfuroxidans]MBR9972739.1 helix-turn-helix domain-containing protein [Magnetospirillum sulfuroxidans]